MTTPGNLTAALAYVPSWWQETTDPTAFDGLLVGWVRACGWRAGGFVWPADGPPSVSPTIQNGVLTPVTTPAEVPDAIRRIRSGEPQPLYPLPGSAGRVYVAVTPPGRPTGLLWAEKIAGQPWTPEDRAYLTLTARTIERSPALSAAIGPVVDPDRLNQRLGDAAVIAGRMAHDFDNILTGIIGFADLSVPLLAPGTQAASFVGEIGKVGHRGIAFTQQLHQLSRSGQVKPGPGSVAAAIAKEETRLRPAMPAGLRIDKDVPAVLPAVALEASSLQTVLGHVIENAAEASPPGGLVRITARIADLSEVEARSFLGKVAPGPHVLVTVTDAGPGMKPEVRRRLFAEPFYTTKVRHRGLGLAVVYRTLSAHKGGVQIDPLCPPATGTQVRLALPLSPVRPAVAGLVVTPPPGQGRSPDDTSMNLGRTPPPQAGRGPDADRVRDWNTTTAGG